jgi:hypothetical protein
MYNYRHRENAQHSHKNRNLEENYHMNKSDKICILHNSVGTYNLCRCYFNYDNNYWYFYILDCSEKFLFGIEDDDFLLGGFQIRKISDLKKIEVKDDICVSINEKKLLENIKKPEIDSDGIWYNEIIYSKITSVTFSDRYSMTWQNDEVFEMIIRQIEEKILELKNKI